MVLRGTYGEKVHKAFRMTRQGVRWRLWRLFNQIYVASFETVLYIEKTFGTGLREHAIRISRERYAMRQEIDRSGFQDASILQTQSHESGGEDDDPTREERG